MVNANLRANAIRALVMDAIDKSKSGHPGTPMGMADIAEVLWHNNMNYNPSNPNWMNRDRFVLSNGHGSMLLYSLLHLTGFDLSIEDIKNFRQLHSKTPGHPEYGYAPGIETTTGPLGQGIANAVGMAIAERTLAAQFNKPNHEIINHYTYAFLGDGCMMEGVSHESCSLAGTLGLNKLIAFYDDNGISIDGEVSGWFTEDIKKRFESYGWNVIGKIDGQNSEEIQKAIDEAKKENSKPTLIICKTIIGYGSPNKEGTEAVHGAPLGAEENAAARKFLGWEYPAFEIPEDIYNSWNHKEAGTKAEDEWNAKFEAYKKDFPILAEELLRRVNSELPKDWEEKSSAFIKSLQDNPQNIASRKASQNAIIAYSKILPEFMGGSADLAPSNLTLWPEAKSIKENLDGNYIHYGVREFGMSAIMNGIALYKGFIPFGATFLMFMEYARNAIRMASLMKQKAIFVYTHDSIGLGEDGPTHQPIEQIPTLRLVPNLQTWRPADQVESAAAWKSAIEYQSPSVLIFSRQNLKQMDRNQEQLNNISKGGYIIHDCEGTPDLIIIATGSEVELAVNTALNMKDKKVRVVSMPCCEVFDKQDIAYKESILPSSVISRMAIEAGHKDYWYKYVGLNGQILGINRFGESAPADLLFKEFGFTLENATKLAYKAII
ncbi:MAG: transketolase [Psittacicella sp.]